MNSRERMKNTIAGKRVDRAPYSFDLTSVIADRIASYYMINPQDVHEFIGDDIRYLGGGYPAGYVRAPCEEGCRIDEFGVIWDTSKKQNSVGDWGEILSSPLKEPSLETYKFPDGHAAGRFDYLRKNALEATGRYLLVAMDGIFDKGWHLRGFENLLADFALEQDFVEELLDRVLEYNLGIISQIPKYIDGIRFGEDWGQQNGLLMGPVFWRQYLKPRLKTMYGAAKKRGFHVMIHSCGDIEELFPDLIEIGVDVVNPVQPEVMDVEFLKREYGRNIVLYGGLGCQSTMPFGSPADVINEAKHRLAVLGDNGGYIFGPAGAVSTEVKTENIVALVDFVRNNYQEQ